MKPLCLHIVLLLAILWVGCHYPSSAAPQSQQQLHSRPNIAAISAGDPWRRTVNGWERRDDWQRMAAPIETHSWLNICALHPLTWATLIGWISVGALVLLQPSSRSCC